MKISTIALRAFAPSLLALTACVATTTPDGPIAQSPPGACNADAAQSLLGQKATLDMGGKLQAMTGAKTVRWVPPRTAVTMDFRADRLTVSYDDDYVIDRISCG